jgi:hypothetical protein
VKALAWSPTPDTVVYATGNLLLKLEMIDGSVFVRISRITLLVLPAYSHDTPTVPAGSDPPPATTLTGSGRLVPRAVLTVAALGQAALAVVTATVAIGAEVAAVVPVAAVGVEAGGAVGEAVLEPPQAAAVRAKTSMDPASHRELRTDTGVLLPRRSLPGSTKRWSQRRGPSPPQGYAIHGS